MPRGGGEEEAASGAQRGGGARLRGRSLAEGAEPGRGVDAWQGAQP